MSDPQGPGAGAESARLAEADAGTVPWRAWGPYLSERAWGTVREDYSADGEAWGYFPHDHARSRAYRWNEDGMAGFCDEGQDWCLSLALWNGVDPILKERMFGLSGPQGNHGEDVKEYWWYVDSTPTHSWNTWRYHYPQPEFPYAQLVDENARRGHADPEFELVDTGVFDDGRYWVVTVDYAKAGPTDLLMRITVDNAGPEEATLHLLPTLWYRNGWSWGYPDHERPHLRGAGDRVFGHSARTGSLVLLGDGQPRLLFCDNETNESRLFGRKAAFAYPKDGINDHVVSDAPTVNPDGTGTKCALHYAISVPPGGRHVVRVRLVAGEEPATQAIDVGAGFDAVVDLRKREADEFYAALTPAGLSIDEAAVLRQAFAGLLWSKQFYHYDVSRWIDGDPGQPPPPPARGVVRNGAWRHVNSHEVLLMPDPWEYPWFAAWDLGFHAVTMAHIDPAFAKEQLVLLLREWYLHPNGQIPAYEWNFSDVNPPVHAWAARRVFQIDGGTDHVFLARVFHKLLMNFTWWVNTKQHGENLFQGGFMGLDNISPVDRSKLPPSVGYLEQADSTAWMAMYALDMLSMALRLALDDRSYEDVATKFFEHFLAIAYAAVNGGLWDEEDGFFYDMFHRADGEEIPIRVRSLGGLIPITAAAEYHFGLADRLPDFTARALWYIENEPELAASLRIYDDDSDVRHRLLSLVSPERLALILGRVFDDERMLSSYGIRSISAWHRDHPFTVDTGAGLATTDYEPAESTSGLFGGNSNWRGPIWFPLNTLLIEALRDYDSYLPGGMVIEYPAGSGHQVGLGEVADDLSRRLTAIFLVGPDGRRPVHGGYDLLATDPRWRDLIPFHEYFHGDNGAGLGASHQTGWTALVAHLLLTREPGS